jgi:DNA polymerase III epsilon subunit-like protein
MKPFSTNVVFVDTEFTQLAADGEILSIALVKYDGSELYIEIEYEGEVSDWVKENVQPYLSGEKVSKDEAVKLIWEFLGDTKPYLVAWVPHFDMVMLYQLFGVENLPVNWFPIDFASMMFGQGLDPENYRDDSGRPFIKNLGIDPAKFKTHHALDDAKLLREVFVKSQDK